jgi:hypothetical protein
MEMDENLKRLMKQLGVAINESLTESEAVSEALAELREAGYDIFLLLEATIGFNQPKQGGREPEEALSAEPGDLVFNAQDAKFLKSMRITLGTPPSPAEE